MKIDSNTIRLLRVEELTPIEAGEINGGGIFKDLGVWFGDNVICPLTCTLKTFFTWQYEDTTPQQI